MDIRNVKTLDQAEDAADFFSQRHNRAELAFVWLTEAAHKIVAHRTESGDTVFVVDGWLIIGACGPDMYLLHSADWYTFIVRVMPESYASGADIALLNSDEWGQFEGLFTNLPETTDKYCSGSAPISPRKQALWAKCQGAERPYSFTAMSNAEAWAEADAINATPKQWGVVPTQVGRFWYLITTYDW